MGPPPPILVLSYGTLDDAVAGSCRIFLYSYLKNGNCVLCVCCSGRQRLHRLRPGPTSSCSSLRSDCFLFVLLLVFIVFLLAVLFTLLQSTVGVGSCFSCAYLYTYVRLSYIHLHSHIYKCVLYICMQYLAGIQRQDVSAHSYLYLSFSLLCWAGNGSYKLCW